MRLRKNIPYLLSNFKHLELRWVMSVKCPDVLSVPFYFVAFKDIKLNHASIPVSCQIICTKQNQSKSNKEIILVCRGHRQCMVSKAFLMSKNVFICIFCSNWAKLFKKRQFPNVNRYWQHLNEYKFDILMTASQFQMQFMVPWKISQKWLISFGHKNV